MGGGSVMIWAALSATEKPEIVFLNGRQKATDYVEMLRNHLPVGTILGDSNWIFQQDNASIHRTSITNDLNPIENMWGILSRGVHAEGWQFNTVQQLKDAIFQEGDKIPEEIMKKLIDSTPNREFEVISKNGGSTKY
ncbi:hypothetical protein B4U79_02733 [Dinothrombium tinctorium]|uniref:Transposable element Tc3 transposase n=1 Tax=Dinothrombium tinctorium TaxID=1965070 RepID=A0A3S3NSP5_9ACAR|nr:hypothetical protein B4U79_02733 [Dinothrombium tinctorium]